MNFQETPKTKKSRIRTGWIILPIGLLFIWLGITMSSEGGYIGPIYRLAAFGIGGLIVLGAVHGLASKPVLTLNDSGIQIIGYIIPTSNLDLKWDDVSSSRIETNAVQRLLWLTNKAGKARLIEENRYEGFQEIVDFSKNKLADKGIVLEIR